MAKDDAEQKVNAEIEQAVTEYIEWAAGLNLSLSDEEIEAKRTELQRSIGGQTSTALATAGTREIENFDEVRDLLSDPEADFLVLDDYQKLDDKSGLVNVPFFVNRWWFTDSDQFGQDGQFAVMRVITSRPIMTPAGETDKVVITDGSTGIYSQLRRITTKTGKTAALMVRHGLRVSEYTADTDQGPKQAKTFYLT
jgi:hypothetical protein